MTTQLVDWGEQAYAAGTYSLMGPAPQGATRIRLRAARLNWPILAGDVVSLNLDLSMDNGQTWTLGHLRCSARGGTLLNRFGVEILETRAECGLPPSVGPARVLRCTMTLAIALDTHIILETEP